MSEPKRLWDDLLALIKKEMIAPALKRYRPVLSQATGVLPGRNVGSSTTSSPGVLTLDRDLGGTADSPLVVGLQGRDLANTAPGNGQAIVWNNGASQWEPGDVTAGGSGYATTIGDGSTTAFTITHNLGTRDVIVEIRKAASTYDYVWPDIQATTTNTITVTFATAPSTNQYRVIVGTGGGVAGPGALSVEEVDGTPTVSGATALKFPNGTLSVSGTEVTYTPAADVGFANPMTTQDDIIIGGASGAATRLAKGSDSQVLTVDPTTHHLVWETPSAGFSDPMTTRGDVIYRNSSNATARLAVGASGKVLSSDGTDVSWGNGPMTTKGDVIAGGTSGAITRLAVGSDNQVLVADSAQTVGVRWATLSPSIGGGNSTSTGAAGSEPGSPASGDLYFPTDRRRLERYDGSAWQNWGLFHAFTKPPTSGWSWVNQGSATVDETNGEIHLVAPAASGTNWRCRMRTVPTAPYKVTMAFVPFNLGVNYHEMGLALRDSASGKLQIILLLNNGVMEVDNYNSATSYSGTYVSTTQAVRPSLLWYRIEDDNTTKYFRWSLDGQNWITFHSLTRTTFLTADQIGFVASSESTTYATMMTVKSWKEE